MSFDDQMRDALVTFTIESLELLEDMEMCLLSLEDGEDTTERINSIFRAAHTIKGSAGLFGLDHIVAFTHVVESLLDLLRAGNLSVSPELVAALLPCCDHIGLLVRDVADGKLEADPAVDLTGGQLLEQLQVFLSPLADKNVATAVADRQSKLEASGGGSIESGKWHLSLRFGPDSLRDGMDPLSFIRYLTTFGQITQLTTISEAMPPAEQMDPETCYVGFEINLKSDAGKDEIEGVFEFVQDSSSIRILPLDSEIGEFIDLIKQLPEDDSYLGELLIKSGALTRRELEDALNQQGVNAAGDAGDTAAKQPIGEILVEHQAVQQPIVNAALDKQKQIKDNKARESQSIRVDADRLDKLIDLIGELVIAGSGVNLRAQESKAMALLEATGEMMRLVEEVRDSALQLRMVPIGTTFNRFQRVVRDVSKELGKEIDLIISGGDTEVDKSIVEQISDPLTHLVRNAMDHGIETAELRRERGKSARGVLRLNAYHAAGNIVIEVSDDGGGLNRDKIFEKALERGLISPNAVLSDQEIFAMIFEPGFSTAQKVSNLSGRGVGMDVVKRNVAALRGSIAVESHYGSGSTMRIHLPLTLAIIDSFMVCVGHSTLVIPLDKILECIALPTDTGEHDYMDLRGEVLPLVHLRPLFNIHGKEPQRKNVVVVEHAGIKAGFIVDRLLGECQTVIKPLGKLFTHIKGVAGSTILGNGKVALILDVPTLVDYVQHKSATVY
ncbi:chemotaxis protein CheA [Methylomonas sp. SURF-2]|uniref:Chemotaxis protein CheA n=1 Tax=Methylomonas subterranea TaxID=2952225 RepID=A0ABT1TES9_9GAMM|nr:chemotaxis protein CheA [Methylomonas sp. SURF-2]MCQ8103973.1 chemotaxis protein CheA [Methylomonas sp. SURF-2]